MSAVPGAGRIPGSPLGPGDGRSSSRLRMLAVLVRQELRIAARRSESLLITFAIPVGLLLMGGFAFGRNGVAATDGGIGTDTLLPGAIALAIVGAALVALGIATAYERAYGVLKRLGGSPAGRGMVVASKTLSIVSIESVQVALLIGAAWFVLGWRPAGDVSPALVGAALVLGTTAFAGAGLLLAATIRPEATIAVTNLVFLVFLALSGAIVPLDGMPDAIAAIAGALPAAPLATLLGIGLGASTADPVLPLLVLTGWAAILGVLAARRFRWD